MKHLELCRLLNATLRASGLSVLMAAIAVGNAPVSAAEIEVGGACSLEDAPRVANSDRATEGCEVGAGGDQKETGEGEDAVMLSLTGTCPGPVTITITTLEPFEEVKVFGGEFEGMTTITTGGCAGTVLDLNMIRVSTRMTTNGAGVRNLSGDLAGRWCGKFIQAHDRSCNVSNLLPITIEP